MDFSHSELISPYYRALCNQAGAVVARQAIFDPRENDETFAPDAMNEVEQMPVPRLIHRYPNQVLLLCTDRCAMRCRFCFRKRLWAGEQKDITQTEILNAAAYLLPLTAVNDLLLSGGDPMLLSDDILSFLLETFFEIKHLQLIRLATRLNVTDPERITDKRAALLARFPRLHIMTHYNHVAELTPASLNAVRKLQRAGLLIFNQSVLLKGINDSVPALKELCNTLAANGIRPHYLFHIDPVGGVAHFATGLRAAHALYAALRKELSSLALPKLAFDLPGGRGKIVLSPDLPLPDDLCFVSPLTGEKIAYPFA